MAATVGKKNRTAIVKGALQEYLDAIEDDETFIRSVVELYLNDRIDFKILTKSIGRQGAESIRASKTLLDQVEKVADELADL